MSFRLLSLQICLGVALLGAGGLLVGSAQAGEKERGRPIEFSVPKSDEVTTNLHELTSKKDGLKQLEEDLYKPLQSFGPGSSLDGVAVPPPRAPSAPVIQSKRVKELLERRKNWGFMSLEDMLPMPTVEDVLKTPQIGPDGQEKKEQPSLERYYHRLSKKPLERENPLESNNEDLFGTTGKSNSRDERSQPQEANLPSGVRETVRALSNLVESDSSESHFSRTVAHGDFSDAFGLGNQPFSKEQKQEHKKLMDDYRSMVDSSWHPPAVATPENLFSTLTADAASSTGKPAVGLPSSLSATPHTALEVQMDVTSPRLGPAGLPDVNSQAVGQTRPTPALPAVEPTRVMPPPPSFAAPKRSFY